MCVCMRGCVCVCVCMGVCEGGEEGLMVGVAEKTTTNTILLITDFFIFSRSTGSSQTNPVKIQ